MSFTEKQFRRETTFQAPKTAVLEAIRSLAMSRMSGWSIEDGLPGAPQIEMRHYADRVVFEALDAPSGTRVVVTYDTPRFGALGFMIWDVGGFYNRTIDKWLHGVWEILGEMYRRAAWASGHAAEPPREIAPPQFQPGQRVVLFDAERNPVHGTVRGVAPGSVTIACDDGRDRSMAPHDVHLTE